MVHCLTACTRGLLQKVRMDSSYRMESESEVAQSCPTFCDSVNCSWPGSSVHGIFQARVLEWGAIAFSRSSSWPRDRTQVSLIVGRRFTVWATREVLCVERALLKSQLVKHWVFYMLFCAPPEKVSGETSHFSSWEIHFFFKDYSLRWERKQTEFCTCKVIHSTPLGCHGKSIHNS